VVINCSFDILTFDVPSCVVLRMFQASLATLQLLIDLKMFLSTPLNKAFKALLLPSARSSSTFDHSSSGFKLNGVIAIFVFDTWVILSLENNIPCLVINRFEKSYHAHFPVVIVRPIQSRWSVDLSSFLFHGTKNYLPWSSPRNLTWCLL